MLPQRESLELVHNATLTDPEIWRGNKHAMVAARVYIPVDLRQDCEQSDRRSPSFVNSQYLLGPRHTSSRLYRCN